MVSAQSQGLSRCHIVVIQSLRDANLFWLRQQPRAVEASRFREARLLCALSEPDAGKLFRVTPRTVRNWEAGRVAVPYAAYKLMRIVRGYELPGHHWKGYRLVGDTLWTPEGKTFKAADGRWWSLTCLMAHQFRADRLRAAGRTDADSATFTRPLPEALGVAQKRTAPGGRGGAAGAPHGLVHSETTLPLPEENEQNRGFQPETGP